MLVMTGLSFGKKARLARLALGLRQLDLASRAGVSIGEVSALEHDDYLRPSRRERVLAILGLLDDDREAEA